MIYGVNENFVVNGEFTPKQANQDMWSESQFYSDGSYSLTNNKSGFVKRYDAYVGIVDLDLEHRRFEKRV